VQDYKSIVKHYESCFQQHGDSPKGVDWPNLLDLEKRYNVMLDVISNNDKINKEIQLLDFGCGTAMLFDHIQKKRNEINVTYHGLEISKVFYEAAKRKYPQLNFYHTDILQPENNLPEFDYIIMNGVFTEKRELSFEEMLNYFKEMLTKIFNHARKGIAFNVMSKHVDWEREDLFHLPFDTLAEFLRKNISRNFIFRNDYGLYEYATYVYRNYQ
jgi:SAM-dependent methyltransferase